MSWRVNASELILLPFSGADRGPSNCEESMDSGRVTAAGSELGMDDSSTESDGLDKAIAECQVVPTKSQLAVSDTGYRTS